MHKLLQIRKKIHYNNSFKNDNQRKLIIILLVCCLMMSLFEASITPTPRYQLLLYGYSVFLALSLIFAYHNFLFPGRLLSQVAGFILITIFVYDRGIHDESIGGYYLLLMIAGLILGNKGSIFFGLLSTISVISIGFAEYFGLLPNRLVPIVDPNEVITAALMMLGTTLVLHYIVVRLHREAESAHAANQSLLELKADLEKRVEMRTAELQDANQQLQEVNQEMERQLNEIKDLRSKLEEEAIRDPLTGLYNRRYLKETLVREFAHARREDYDISFMLLDIDHFKKFNDLYGHATGDLAIKTVAKQLTSRARAAGIACRMGGEEFLLVMPGILDEVAQLRAEYFRDQIMALPIPYGDENLALTVSIGVASFPKNGETWEELYEAVDQALYRAKQNGRNRVECA